MSIQRAVAEAVSAAATILRQYPSLPAGFKEKDFQKVFAEALQESLAAFGPEASVRQNLTIKLDNWPGVGPVDVSVRGNAGEPLALFELKWGTGTLYNCVWDVEKLAVAVATRVAPAGFLVAGAPSTDWESALGHELFAADEWSTSDLLRRYDVHWKFWRGDVQTHPLHLPEVVRTRAIAAAETWPGFEIKCVEILVPLDTWLNVEEEQARLSALRERLTWKPGDVDILTREEAEKILGFKLPPVEADQ